MKRMGIGTGLGFVLALGLAACAVTPEDGSGSAGAGNEPVGSVRQQIDSCGCNDSSYQVFSVSNGSANDLGLPNDDFICWPTKPTQASGSYDVNLRTYPGSDGTWDAWGHGEVQCVPQCCFYSNGGSSDVRWRSGVFVAGSSTPPDSSTSTDMWADDSMPIMSGFRYTNSDAVWQFSSVTFDSPWNGVHSWTQGEGAETGTTHTWGYSFFVGIPSSSHNVQYIDYPSTGGTKTHISSSAGICTFWILVAEDRPTSGTYARIFRSGGVWKSQKVHSGVNLQVRCFYFDQDQ